MKRHGLWNASGKLAIGLMGVFCLGNCNPNPAVSDDPAAAANVADRVSTLAVSGQADQGEILDSGWNFEDVNTVAWAHAGRAAARICEKRGLAGGFFNGNQTSGSKELVCVGGGAQLIAVTPGELLDSGWVFEDTNRVGWAHASRAAAKICAKHGFIGGFFNGDQDGETTSLICVNEGAKWFNVTPGEVLDSGFPFDDNNTIPWAHARRAAAVICGKHGFVGGFFNGGQTFGRRGLVCVR